MLLQFCEAFIAVTLGEATFDQKVKEILECRVRLLLNFLPATDYAFLATQGLTDPATWNLAGWVCADAGQGTVEHRRVKGVAREVTQRLPDELSPEIIAHVKLFGLGPAAMEDLPKFTTDAVAGMRAKHPEGGFLPMNDDVIPSDAVDPLQAIVQREEQEAYQARFGRYTAHLSERQSEMQAIITAAEENEKEIKDAEIAARMKVQVADVYTNRARMKKKWHSEKKPDAA